MCRLLFDRSCVVRATANEPRSAPALSLLRRRSICTRSLRNQFLFAPLLACEVRSFYCRALQEPPNRATRSSIFAALLAFQETKRASYLPQPYSPLTYLV